MNTTISTNTRLEGWALILARSLWFAIAFVTFVTLVVALPIRLSYLSKVLWPPIFGDAPGPLGLTPDFAATYITAGETLFGLFIWFTIGAFVFWRKSDDRLVIFFSAMMVSASVFMSDYAMPLPEVKPAWGTLVIAMRAFTFAAILIFYYIFPNGRFFPRFTRPLAVVWVAYTVSWIFIPGLIPPSNHIITTPKQMVLGILFFLWLGSGALAQLYRFHRVRNPVERQQTKWIVFGTSAAAVGTIATFSPPMFFVALRTPGPSMVTYVMIAFSLVMLSLALIPVTIAISILRYRLWEIDLIINKALVYGALTTALALVYFLSIALLQGIFPARSPIAIVLSTLAIAALFAPLRRRIQNAIDRRFYRRKYDAEKTLAAFSTIVRDEVDMERLSGALLGAVEETMQPEHMSLWFRREKRRLVSDE